MNPQVAIAHSKADIRRLDGQLAEVVGTYHAIEEPKKGQRTGGASPRDRAIVELSDGTKVFVEALSSPNSRRPAEELRSFDGKQVRVRGVVRALMPSPGQGLVAPCICDIEDLREK
jgi:hypothetical protein